MAFLEIRNVAIKGISASAPKQIDNTSDVYKWEGVNDFIASTGIKHRRRTDSETTSADLCCIAAERLIDDLGWERESIDVLVFVTQTPDYVLPATSCILQERLRLPIDCYTLDISLGCSGWVYALSVIASLMQSGTMRRGLLLAGETCTKLCSPEDKSTYPLFGDAGTATALEFEEGCSSIKFLFNSNGKGAETIIVRDGGFRNMVTAESLETKCISENICRNGMQLELNGMDVFSFGITKVPKSVKALCEHYNMGMEEIDLFTFHQANKMMNDMIVKKLKIDNEKVPYSLEDFGNTSCASIPLTLVTKEGEALRDRRLRHIACGFGVGLSWGSVYFETDRIAVPGLVVV